MAKKKREYKIEQSPFYDKYSNKVRANLKELNASNGEEVVLARKRYYRQDEYIKFIIHNQFDILAFYKLPNIAKTVLHYILYFCVEYNSPTFRLKAKDLGDILETDTAYIHKGIRALCDFNYIAKTKTREVYWINHNVIYKGNFMIDKFLKTK